jgi:chaperone required for assembly of F1-ATPase
MRDIFEELFAQPPADPMEAARRGMRPAQRRRFYSKVEVAEDADGFHLLLDGKPVRTPARRILAAPARALAQALAAEWEAQGEHIDPVAMPLTRLANAIIDGVSGAVQPVADEIAKYLATDLLFYRAAEPQRLVERQARHWDPLLDWAHREFGARFVLAQGVVHVAQPERALVAARAAIPPDPWRLGALSSITTLTGSALLALAMLHGAVAADEAWAAAHVDEDWNMERWGGDELALARRAFRRAEFDAAAAVLARLP